MSIKSAIGKFFSVIWSGVDGLRKLMHLVLLLVVFLAFFGAMADAPMTLPKSAALVIQPYGALVEQLEGDPYGRAIAELLDDGQPQTLVQDIVDALEYAYDDDRIEMVHLELSGVGSAGLSKLQRLATAITEFKTSGKRVVASADFLSQGGFYIGAHADELYLHPNGLVLLRGYGRYQNYFKEAIDHLRVDWNVFRVGTHKSFVEPYLRMDMSDEDRESTEHLVGQLWGLYQTDVEAARELDEGTIDDFATNMIDHISAAEGDIAIAALDHGLVDGLLSRTAMRELLIEDVGEDAEDSDTFSGVGMHEYLAQMKVLEGSSIRKENVAVIVASGEILFGSQPPGLIGADSTAALLRRALRDDSVKAVVLRVDSPGGSAFAAEIINDEIAALQASGKPLVASMGSVAASGGYSISMGADRIFASPATITGSIGVFGMFPTYQRTLATIGINTDGVGTTPWSGELRPDREMSPHAKQLFQLFVEDTYDDFITDVADYRGLDKSAVDAIGQGQVWTGVDAIENGLVDELGRLEDAIAAAAELADLDADGFGVKLIETELSTTEQMVVDLLSVARHAGLSPDVFVSAPSALESLAERVGSLLATSLRFNDPNGIYTHCLCSFD